MTSLRYLMVACVEVPLRKFGERLSIARANLNNRQGPKTGISVRLGSKTGETKIK